MINLGLKYSASSVIQIPNNYCICEILRIFMLYYNIFSVYFAYQISLFEQKYFLLVQRDSDMGDACIAKVYCFWTLESCTEEGNRVWRRKKVSISSSVVSKGSGE